MAPTREDVPPVKYPHIVIDSEGVAHIEGSRSKVIQVAVDVVDRALTPQQIHEQYPHLSLAAIHSALAYYYDHKEALDVEIERRHRYAEQMRAEDSRPLTRTELQERLRRQTEADSSA